MNEVGLSMDEDFPKPISDELLGATNVVISMGCGDSGPHLPGRRYEDWDITDPADHTGEAVDAIRDDIKGRVLTLLRDLHHTEPEMQQRETP